MTWGLHPHTVSCFYVRTLGGIPRVFAEYVAGGDLKEWLDRGKVENHKTALDIAIQVARGMAFAHEKGLIHRDLKPHNVLMTPEGTAKVTDFGLARYGTTTAEDDDGASPGAVQVTTAAGSRGYAAPEQASAGAVIDHRADIFAFGVLLWRLLGGRITWYEELGKSVIANRAVAALLKRGEPADFPEPLRDLVLRCLEPEPEDRWANFSIVCQNLQTAYTQITGEAYGRPEPKPADLQADGLNNRGVSFWDLGKMKEAEAAFEEALKLDPQHVRATFNLGLLQWRDGRSTDVRLLTQLRETCHSHPDNWETAYTTGLVRLEGMDPENAVKSLEEAQELGGGAEVESSLEQARRMVPNSPRCVRTFEGHTEAVTSVAFSPDGRFCLSGKQGRLINQRQHATTLGRRDGLLRADIRGAYRGCEFRCIQPRWPLLPLGK